MALPTFLELVNDVLIRMREPEVSTVNENVLSKLVGKFVNDAKRQVEAAYNWRALKSVIPVTTSNGVYNYTLANSNVLSRVEYVWNNSSKGYLNYIDTPTLNAWLSEASPSVGSPEYVNFSGFAGKELTVDLYPIPDAAYTIQFSFFNPQADLNSDADTMKVPSEPVIFLAYAKAAVERGEDGGLSSSEAYGLYRQSLADHVAIESGRHPDGEIWEAV